MRLPDYNRLIMSESVSIRRVILIVLDSVGIGSLPDAGIYGDAGSHTLKHIMDRVPGIHIPNLLKMGLGFIEGMDTSQASGYTLASYGRAGEKSAGKDTTTGHWEIAGVILEKPFPVFANGFPDTFIQAFETKIGRKTLGNYAASGTKIIDDLGSLHIETGKPIVYTSADSVFQIAMHEEIIPLEEQYHICAEARKMLTGDLAVGRVIARPFNGKEGNFYRTGGRKDFSLAPPYNVLDAVVDAGLPVTGVGKISDIFGGRNITRSFPTKNNAEGIAKTMEIIQQSGEGLVFTNLVDFDMLFGHRRDPEGYASCLESFDREIPALLESLTPQDLLIITADHGNDPTWTGTDHTREYIPILAFGHQLKSNYSLGTRETFADIAATTAEALQIPYHGKGISFYSDIKNK